ncbi:helix-turn-helix domain-containing protein [Streptomyces sp. HUAS TT11]|uniref:helix-turn-helix domain-containing protein n=1 Tax=Streptomyces sp. HUAS TT11 TaxID=3447508 RepID=UPI003F65E7DF
MEVQQLAEYRNRAVREVLGGFPIGDVAARYGTSRQTPGLLDRSRRPWNSPTRLSADVEAEICELRRRYPRWGARRISHELTARGLEAAPSRATVHRVLSRNGLVRTQEQQNPRKYAGGSANRPCTRGRWTCSAGSRWATGGSARWSPASTTTPGSS